MSIFKQGKYSHKARGKKPDKRQQLKMWLTALSIFLAIMIGTAAFLWLRGVIAQRQFDKMALKIHGAETTETTALPAPSEAMAATEESAETAPATAAPTDPAEKVMLEKYVEDYEKNPEFFGWIRMHDTKLDYPVMQSSDGNNEKYLNLNFAGVYSAYGVPFADIKCTRDSDNIIIYGHNQNNGTMFRPLFQYEDEAFFKENPTLMFSDLYGDYEYEILSVFKDQIYKKTDTRFKYYQFIDAENEDAFDYAIDQFKEKSLYDTGVDAEYGDKLIMLITCSYHTDNGRFVVVARRKAD